MKSKSIINYKREIKWMWPSTLSLFFFLICFNECFLVLSSNSPLTLSLFLIILRCRLLGEAVLNYFFSELLPYIKQKQKQRRHALPRTSLFLPRFIWQIVFFKNESCEICKFSSKMAFYHSGHSLFVKLNEFSCIHLMQNWEIPDRRSPQKRIS